MKYIKELNKWKDVPCLWIGRLSIAKMAVVPNLITDSVQPQSKSQPIIL